MACKLFSGRKRENSVWQYFKYDAVVNKSTCLVSIADDKQCSNFYHKNWTVPRMLQSTVKLTTRWRLGDLLLSAECCLPNRTGWHFGSKCTRDLHLLPWIWFLLRRVKHIVKECSVYVANYVMGYGKMNHLSVNLERRVFMKLNMELLNVIWLSFN